MLKLIVPTDNDSALLSRMAELYSYDFSALEQLKMGPDGLFPAVKGFYEMWSDPDRYPYIFLLDSEPAGFALVRQISTGSFDMEQFFVMKKFRRSGVGKDAAHALFRTFSGNWTVGQTSTNINAQAFWRSVIAEFTNGEFQEIGNGKPTQSFVT